MDFSEFNATSEVERLRKINEKIIEAKRGKRHRIGESRLDKFKMELLSMYRAGATLTLLQIWLRERKISVQLSTISRWIKKNS